MLEQTLTRAADMDEAGRVIFPSGYVTKFWAIPYLDAGEARFFLKFEKTRRTAKENLGFNKRFEHV